MITKYQIAGICFLIVLGLQPYQTYAGCSIHDHNCFHGAYPYDPALGNVPTGPGSLNVKTTYGGAPDVDLNQHVGLPINQGPFVASNPDGNPVEATPLGGGPNVIYHNQQTVQYVGGTSGGQLISSPGTESTTMIGNVAEGTYGVAIYNYDQAELDLTGSYSTTATAGGTGHFDGPSQSHIASPYVQSIGLGGGSLAPDQASGTQTFEYYDNNFNPHATGVYIIPDGVWNIGGVDIAYHKPKAYQFEFQNTNISQDFAVYDFMSHIQPEATQANYEYGGWVYDKSNGGFVLSLSVGEQDEVTIYSPMEAIPTGSTQVAMFHTHQNSDNLIFSDQDLSVAYAYGVDTYLVNGRGDLGKLSVDAPVNHNADNLSATLEWRFGAFGDFGGGHRGYEVDENGNLTENYRGGQVSFSYSIDDDGNPHATASSATDHTHISPEDSLTGTTIDAKGGIVFGTDQSFDPNAPNANTTEIDSGRYFAGWSDIPGPDSNDIMGVNIPDQIFGGFGANPMPGYTGSTTTVDTDTQIGGSGSNGGISDTGDCGCGPGGYGGNGTGGW